MDGRAIQGRSTRIRTAVALFVATLSPVFVSAAPQLAALPLAWRDAGGDTNYRIEQHEWSSTETRTSRPSEYIRLAAGYGTRVYLAREIPPASVIDELQAEVWLKSDRPGAQILARVVLPRAGQSSGGEPLSVLIRGASYTRPGIWQALVLDDVPTRLTEAVRRLRASGQMEVDPRGAYIDQLLLNVYGGAGQTQVWLEEVQLRGAIQPPASTALRVSAQRATGEEAAAEVKLQGSMLTVNGRPLFPRVIEHRGERFESLAAMGFNAVRLTEVPTQEQLDDAERAGLWIVCPPPLSKERATRADRDAPNQSEPVIPASFRQVLAWDLGRGYADADLDQVRSWARAVRRADARLARPILLQTDAQLRAYSRHADLLLLDRRPLCTSLSLAAYGQWIGQRSQLARPGTPFWATIQTEPSPAVVSQWQAILGRRDQIAPLEPEQIRLLSFVAVSSGVRGLFFASGGRLDADDPATLRRRLALTWINRDLALMEPWAAGGTRIAEIASQEPNVQGAVLKTNRARLVLPIWLDPNVQYVTGNGTANSLSLVVPGVPEAHRAFELTSDGLHLLQSNQRVTGGVRLTLDEMDTTAMVVLSQDPLAYAQLASRLSATRVRSSELMRQLAEDRMARVTSVFTQLSSWASVQRPETTEMLADARAELQQSHRLASSTNTRRAETHARRALQLLRHLSRFHWEQATAQLPTPVANPLALSFETLPAYWRSLPAWYGRTDGTNRLAGGDFERLSEMDWAGWRHFTYQQHGVKTQAELSPVNPHRGGSCLTLLATSDTETPLTVIESTPVWVTSGGVDVPGGSWVRIDGWVRVPKPIVGSVDRLLIMDSLGGPALAQRIERTEGWEPLTLYRYAAEPTTLEVTVALTGLGEASIDDMRVTILPTAPPRTAQADSPWQPISRLPTVTR